MKAVFNQILDFVKGNNIDVIVMYGLTGFYRPSLGQVIKALEPLRKIIDKHNVLVDFAHELEIEDLF